MNLRKKKIPVDLQKLENNSNNSLVPVEDIYKKLTQYHKLKSSGPIKIFLKNLKPNFDLTIKTNKKSKNNIGLFLATIIFTQEYLKSENIKINFEIKSIPEPTEVDEQILKYLEHLPKFTNAEFNQYEQKSENNVVADCFRFLIQPSKEHLKKFRIHTRREITLTEIISRMQQFKLNKLQLIYSKKMISQNVFFGFSRLNYETLYELHLELLPTDQQTTQQQNTRQLIEILSNFKNLNKLSVKFRMQGLQKIFVQQISKLQYLKQINFFYEANLSAADMETILKNNIFLQSINFIRSEQLSQEVKNIKRLICLRKLNYDTIIKSIRSIEKSPLAQKLRVQHIYNILKFLKTIVF